MRRLCGPWQTAHGHGGAWFAKLHLTKPKKDGNTMLTNKISLGLVEARRLTLRQIKPLSAENVALIESVDRVAASDIFALVDSPSVDASLKDGYAFSSRGVSCATEEEPVQLRLVGSVEAGSETDFSVQPGMAVRILTGAHIPIGVDAVIREEDARRKGNAVLIDKPVQPGTEILSRGTDVACGEYIVRSGQEISPGLAGLLAAAGHTTIPVFKNPLVAIIGTGDEIVAPGQPLPEGKLYASNVTTLAAWCRKYGMKTRLAVVKDDHRAIGRVLRKLSTQTDAMITSGGAWTGEHDMVATVLEELGWKQIFHRIRIGPGKAVGFGMLEEKPVFILPGGPPSNLMGFLQIALPGLLALSGHENPGLPTVTARLASEIRGKDAAWTDFVFGVLQFSDKLPAFCPLDQKSRLSSIAEATALASIPEGRNSLPEGSVISVQVLK